MSRLVLIVIATLACNAPAQAQLAEAASTSQPSSQPVDDGKIAGLIEELNDPDPAIREQATKSLWSRGKSIAPALRTAAASGPPEVARRARSILRDFMYGLYPDTPKEIFNLLDQYRSGDLGQKQTAIWMLNSRGIAGLRVLLKLQADERDEELKKMISRVLEPRAHYVAVMLIAEGETAAAEQNLESAAESASVTSSAALDYAAYLATTGKLAGKRKQMEAEPLTARNAVLRFALARAARDLTAAKAAAEKITDPDYLDFVLVEQGDWAELAKRVENAPRLEPAERLGFLCTYYRLGGDEANYRKAAEEIVKRAKAAPQDAAFCAENLFLNGMPKEAEQVLLDRKEYLLAASYLAPRLELKKALELPVLAMKGQPTEVAKVRLRTVEALHFAGENEKARQVLDDVAAENKLRNDPAIWELLLDSALQMGRQPAAEQYFVEILTRSTNQDPLVRLFERMRFDDGQAASQWWHFLRHEHPSDPVAQTFKDLQAIFARRLKSEELVKLSMAAEKYLGALQPVERESWQEAAGDVLDKCGQTELAAQWFSRLGSSTGNPRVLIHIGDFEAGRRNWTAAARFYEAAWERDYTRASALFLRGWALSQAGRSDEGRAMMEDAERLPLGSELARRELLEAMRRHNLDEAFRREVDLMLTLTPLHSYERNETLREAAEIAAAKLDYQGAVGIWERAFLTNLTNLISFQEPWANVVVPALIHKVRTLGLIQSGDIAGAVKEAKFTLDMVPADADTLIDIVNALDKANHKVEAEELYRQYTDYYRQLTTEYRRSGPAHNQLAWAQVMCHRDLDDALTNAKKAVELEPTSTASIDTLAEVYFAKHDAKGAAEQMKKCMELEPTVPRHRQQLARFEKAVAAAATQTTP